MTTPVEADTLREEVERLRARVAALEQVEAERDWELQALRESEERAHIGLEGSHVGLWDWHVPSGKVAFVRHWGEILGYDPEDCERDIHMWERNIHPEDKPWVMKAVRDHFEGVTPIYEALHRIRARTGEYHWILDRGRVVERDQEGRPVRAIGLHMDLTRQRRVEQAFEESEARFRSAFEYAPIGIALVDMDGRALMVNRALADMLGYAESDLIGRRFHDITHPDDLGKNLELGQQMLAGEIDSFQVEKRFFHKAGRIVWASLSASFVRTADGKPWYVVSQIQDITERKRAEDALRSAYEKLRDFESVINRSPAVVFVWRCAEGWPVEFVSENVSQFGYTAEDFTSGRVSWPGITHPEDVPRLEAEVKQYTEQGITGFLQYYRPMARSGEERWVEDRTVALKDAQGNVTHYQGIILDITKRKQVEDALRLAHDELERRVTERTEELVRANTLLQEEMARRQSAQDALRMSEERYRTLFEDCPVALMEHDISAVQAEFQKLRDAGVTDLRRHLEENPGIMDSCHGRVRVVSANRAALKLYAASATEEFGADLHSIVPEDSRQRGRSVLLALAEGRTSMSVEGINRTLDGNFRHVLINFMLAPGASPSTRLLLAISDISQLRQAEQELAHQREALLHQRMESLVVTGRLAAGVAHEINNPLQGIVAQLRLLSDELPEEMRGSRRLTLIQDSIRQISRIVRNLLDLHRTPPSGARSCSASKLMSDISELVAAQLTSAGVTMKTTLAPGDILLPIAQKEMGQVLLNLILNARDAMPKGGQVHIKMDEDGTGVNVFVSDDGPGISPEARAQIFSPFFTTKGPRGTGLGLSVTHSLITAAGGSIEVFNRDHAGATFHIRFPRAK